MSFFGNQKLGSERRVVAENPLDERADRGSTSAKKGERMSFTRILAALCSVLSSGLKKECKKSSIIDVWI